ncbi:MAG TPA: GNAT family N-acetyltransferase [Candidatus Deferrimicrobiaceae bacterium]|nr:GNAT family N-acetyltransferase [Candidatus Deferrimicrobiaceae bacterium]
MVADWIPKSELGVRMLLHEAEAQQTPERRLRDLGDGWLLHDRSDAEPFWTRLIAPRWPHDAGGFDRRLDEIVTLFATIDRLPHVRPAPLATEPFDLPDRLMRYGFRQVAADRRMVLVDAEPCLSLARTWDGARRAERWPGGLAVTRYGAPMGAGPDRRRWAADTSLVLAEAFVVDPLRRSLLEGDALACVGRPGCTILLLRAEAEPVAVARLARAGDGAYLSSIGVRPAWRRRGYGALVTALAVAEAIAAGSRLVHLAVEVENDPARALYERLGFEIVGEPAPDLLLR